MQSPDELIGLFEVHDAGAIRKHFERGTDPNQLHNGRPLIYELINMYLRSPRFKDCIRAFVEHGLQFYDKALLAVLLDDADMLTHEITNNAGCQHKHYTFNAAFTPLEDATLLHICAEYNHTQCAEALLKAGADVNIKAGYDEHGFGGHTPVFHAVNQHENNSFDILKLLLSHGADLSITVKGLIWGQGYEWETFIPSVNPLSYAMMGLLRQFQRKEVHVYAVVHELMKARYGTDYHAPNVPNRYLQ